MKYVKDQKEKELREYEEWVMNKEFKETEFKYSVESKWAALKEVEDFDKYINSNRFDLLNIDKQILSYESIPKIESILFSDDGEVKRLKWKVESFYNWVYPEPVEVKREF